MLRKIELVNFKAFERFTIVLRGNAFLVGPNNAGKSTLIAAVRAAANMLRLASRRRAMDSLEVDRSIRLGHSFSGDQIGLVQENLRHEFHQIETRLRLMFAGGAELVAVWPPGDDTSGFVFFRHKDKTLSRPKEIREAFPSVGLIPVLSPLEHDEDVLSESHVRANYDTRLASRHFRNQLYLLQYESADDGKTRYEDFQAFAAPWVPELDLGSIRASTVSGSLDLTYHESGSNKQKEAFWLGDGMQIWLQLLLHIFRLQATDVIVLDEPDIFLHADLQRRLVDLIESIPGQAVTATHSAEVLAEADADSIVWVARNRKRALVAPDDSLLASLSATLGTQFNLRLARTLRTKAVLFVEGKDAKLLRVLAGTLGATNVAREDGLTIVSLDGIDRADHLDAFAWLVDEVLESSVCVFVVLDRDYKDGTRIKGLESKLRKAGIRPHVWERHELENYLLSVDALARVSGAKDTWIATALDELAGTFEDEVYSGIAAKLDSRLRREGVAPKSISMQAKQIADDAWKDPANRLLICPGKELLRGLNQRLQEDSYKPLRARQIARALSESEIPPELRRFIREVDSACS